MTAPTEPLVMTLEEAFAAAGAKALEEGARGYKVMSVRYYPFAHYPWRVEMESGRVKVYEDWPSTFSHALGRPVVARDDAAELRAALVAICEGAPEEEPDWYEGDNHGDTAGQAAEREHYRLAQIARAALAATEGEAA